MAIDNKEIKQNLIKDIKCTEERVINNSNDLNTLVKLHDLKQKLDIFISAETVESARIRSREK